MVGVSIPATQRNRRTGFSFLLFYTLGSAMAAMLMIVVLIAVRELFSVLPLTSGTANIMVALSALAFGVLDLFGKTPHVRRQTPKGLRELLGHRWSAVVWGFDIGLGFTTIKVSSMLWVSVIVAILVGTNSGITIAVVVFSAIPSIWLWVLSRILRSREGGIVAFAHLQTLGSSTIPRALSGSIIVGFSLLSLASSMVS